MGIEKVKGEISDYLKKGWEIEKTANLEGEFYLVSPDGYIFQDIFLRRNICAICEDAEVDGCSGLHSDKTLEEEATAVELCRLLYDLPMSDLDQYLSLRN